MWRSAKNPSEWSLIGAEWNISGNLTLWTYVQKPSPSFWVLGGGVVTNGVGDLKMCMAGREEPPLEGFFPVSTTVTTKIIDFRSYTSIARKWRRVFVRTSRCSILIRRTCLLAETQNPPFQSIFLKWLALNHWRVYIFVGLRTVNIFFYDAQDLRGKLEVGIVSDYLFETS